MDSHIIFRVLLIIIAAFVLIMLINYYNTKQKDSSAQKERFFNPSNNSVRWDSSSNGIVGAPVQIDQPQGIVKPSEESYKDDNYRPVDFETQQLPSDCFPRDRLTSEDLLPKDAANSKFAQVMPAGQGDVANQNFLTAGYHLGIDTVGSTQKNANLQLRSDPVIQKGSWPIMNSSIDPDLLRRKFDLE